MAEVRRFDADPDALRRKGSGSFRNRGSSTSNPARHPRALELEIVWTLALDPKGRLVDELNDIIALQLQLAKAGNFEKFTVADNEFHRCLYVAAGKQGLWTLVRRRSGHIDRLRRLHLPSPGKAQDIVRHHRLIAQSIAAGEPENAQRHLRKHLSGTLGYLDEIRARHPEYLAG